MEKLRKVAEIRSHLAFNVFVGFSSVVQKEVKGSVTFLTKVRVAIVHNILTPYTVPLFNELATRESLDIRVYSMAESESNRHWAVGKELNFSHVVLSGRHPRIVTNDTYTIHANPGIVKEIAHYGPDILVSSGYASVTNQLAFIATRLMRIPFVLWWGSTANENSLFREIMRPYVKWLVSQTDGFIAYGSLAKDYLLSLGAPPQTTFVAHNTVDVEFFTNMMQEDDFASKRDSLKNELAIDADIILLYVGQLIERKGLDTLFEAVGYLQDDMDIATVLVGTGRDYREFVRKASALKKVHFVGNVDYDRLPYYYGLGHLLVLPSIYEVWGLVVNEAMACGLPVIVSRTAGCSADLIREGVNGYTFEPNNGKSLAERIRQVAADKKRMLEFGRESQRLVTGNFTINKCADQIEDAILNLARPQGYAAIKDRDYGPSRGPSR